MMALPRAELEELLRFYAEAGVDEPLDEEPIDRFAIPAAEPARALSAASAVAPPADPPAPSSGPSAFERYADATPMPRVAAPAAIPDEATASRARDMARSARSLDELRDLLAGFDGCNLKSTAKTMVFADGNPEADVMFVGEAPGREEDLEGLPFVGRSGQLLDRMLAAIGLDRTTAYIANVIPWRPPGNRTPTPLETEICRPFIARQIELANPKVLVTLGGPSAKVLLDTSEGIMRLRGTWRMHLTASGTEIPAMPTLHPAYLLRNPAHKRLAWRDFLEIKARLKAL